MAVIAPTVAPSIVSGRNHAHAQIEFRTACAKMSSPHVTKTKLKLPPIHAPIVVSTNAAREVTMTCEAGITAAL